VTGGLGLLGMEGTVLVMGRAPDDLLLTLGLLAGRI
jgi:hypothetical protein